MIPTPHVINVLKGSSKDSWGIKLTDSKISYEAFVQSSSAVVKNQEDKEVKVSLNITILGKADIQYQDKIEYGNLTKAPISIEDIVDLSGKTVGTKVLV